MGNHNIDTREKPPRREGHKQKNRNTHTHSLTHTKGLIEEIINNTFRKRET